MTARQLRELQHFCNIEPIGEYRSELRHGQQMALTANINRDEKVKSEPWKSSDFMNFQEQEPERIYTDEELEEYAKKVFGA
jgi:hypothetical protein